MICSHSHQTSEAPFLWKNQILLQILDASVSYFDKNFRTKTSDTFSPSKDPNLFCENDQFVKEFIPIGICTKELFK